jgi:hypothetical protein
MINETKKVHSTQNWTSVGNTDTLTLTDPSVTTTLAKPKPSPVIEYWNTAHNQSVSRKKAVLVEPFHKQRAIQFVIENALEKLPMDWDILVYMPEEAKVYVEQICNGTFSYPSSAQLVTACKEGRVRHIHLSNEYKVETDHHIYSPEHWRNQLFANTTWWKELEADWVLFFQADSIICKSGDPPMQFEYLGGPSFPHESYRWTPTLSYKGHMNGGFSVRKVDWVIDCLNSRNSVSSEDSTFSVCQRENRMSPTFNNARAFAADNGWTGCFTENSKRICPYGMHKPWKNESITPIEIQELYDHCTGADQLLHLNQLP